MSGAVQHRVRAALAVALGLSAAAWQAAAASAPEVAEFHYEMLVGRYVVIGRMPEGGATYAAQADIAYAHGMLTLTRTEGGATVTWPGRIERASPGERLVVRFEGSGRHATCLTGMDLENYARLTCYWVLDGQPVPRQPGLEAYFSTEVWPS